jgi:hypothetical protein
MFSRLDSLPALLLAALIAGCGGPFLVLPGGKLEGTVIAAPEDWSVLREVKTVQLETRPDAPYSVNIWAVGMGSRVYVHAGANRSTWVEHMEADPSVRLRVEDLIYELEATRVESQDEFDRFSDAYEKKYGSRPRNEVVTEAYLFRLEAP